MDSDVDREEDEKEELERIGIEVFSWEKGNAIEEQLFQDSSSECAEQLIAYAVEVRGIQSVKAKLDNEFKDELKKYQVEDETIILCRNDKGEASKDVLRRIGTVAKGKFNKKKGKTEGAWFKRIDLGQDVGNIVFSSEKQIVDGSCFKKTIDSLLKWVTKK